MIKQQTDLTPYIKPFSCSRVGLLILLSVISLFSLSSCALFGHKKPAQKVMNTGLTTIHTLDVYTEKNTIHALFSGIDRNTQRLALKYITSLDTGKSWSTPVTVNQGLATVKKSKRGNDFQIAAFANKIMAVWQTQGGEPWTGKLAAALSTDFGRTWKAIASPVDDQYAKIDQGYFDLTADNQGQFHITWLDDREEAGDTQGLRYARFSDKGSEHWDQHADLELTACTCCWSSITSDVKGHLHVLYRDDNPRDMRIISSLDGGLSWKKSKSAGNFGWEFIGCPHQGGGLTATTQDDKVTLHGVLWNGKTSNRGIYYSQSDSDKDNVAVLMPIGDNTSSSADIAAMNANQLRIIYTAGDFESSSVFSKASNDGGRSWSNEQRLTLDGAEPSHPRIIATEKGFLFFWTEWQKNGDAVAIISELE